MTFMKALTMYWIKVIVRAFTDAIRLCGANPRATLTGVFGLTIAAAIYSYLQGPDKTLDKVLWFALTTLGAWGITFTVVIILALIVTPYRLHQELLSESNTKRVELESNNIQLQNDNEALVIEVDRARNADATTNFKRAQLRKFIGRFEAIVRRLQSSQPSSCEEFFETDLEAHTFITKAFDGYRDYDRKYQVQNAHTYKSKPEPDDYRLLAEASSYRLSKLRELLEILG